MAKKELLRFSAVLAAFGNITQWAQGHTKPADSPEKVVVPLPMVLRMPDGRTVRALMRSGKSAIYALCRDELVDGYEVFKIRIKKARRVFGKDYPAAERYPSNEDFGRSALSKLDFESAFEEYESINQTGGFIRENRV